MKPRTLLLLLTVLFLAFVSAASVLGSPVGIVQVSFINVGQGDAALVREPGGIDILIDGGDPAAGPTVVAYLYQQGATDLEVMLVSHTDRDHIGGLIDVLEDTGITVQQVLYGGYPGVSDTWYAFATAVAEDGLALATVQYPQVITWGETTGYILNPDAAMSTPNTPEPNEASVVLLLQHGQVGFLFTGDIDQAIEKTVVARQTPVAAEVLKVAHHGSKYSSGLAFLEAVQPTEAVISVGDNSYGHPAPEVLATLEALGVRVWRTDHNGTILMYSDGINVTVVAPLQSGYLPLLFKSLPATPTPTPTPTVTSTTEAQGTPTPTSTQPPPPDTATPTFTPTPTQVAGTGNVTIVTIFYDGSGSQEPDEYVEIRNDEAYPIQLQDWTLRDEAAHVFTFPGYVMAPGQTCRVYTNEDHPEWCGFNYGSGTAIWNNGEDCGYLRDASDTEVSRYCYP